jgi:hypothetical protein
MIVNREGDLGLSYRMQRTGYRVLNLKDGEASVEIPVTVPRFKRQLSRWANGTLRAMGKFLPSPLRDGNMGRRKRLERLLNLSGYLIHPSMVMSFLVACLARLLSVGNSVFSVNSPFSPFRTRWSLATLTEADLHLLLWGPIVTVIVVGTVAPWISSIVARKPQHLPVASNLPGLLVLYLQSGGISLVNTIEPGKALLTTREWGLTDTPKDPSLKDLEDWHSKIYSVSLDLRWVAGVLLLSIGFAAIIHPVSDSAAVSLVLLVPCTAAYAFILAMTALESRRGHLS